MGLIAYADDFIVSSEGGKADCEAHWVRSAWTRRRRRWDGVTRRWPSRRKLWFWALRQLSGSRWQRMEKTTEWFTCMGGAARCLLGCAVGTMTGPPAQGSIQILGGVPLFQLANAIRLGPTGQCTFEERLRVDSVVSLTVILSVGCTSDVCVGIFGIKDLSGNFLSRPPTHPVRKCAVVTRFGTLRRYHAVELVVCARSAGLGRFGDTTFGRLLRLTTPSASFWKVGSGPALSCTQQFRFGSFCCASYPEDCRKVQTVVVCEFCQFLL